MALDSGEGINSVHLLDVTAPGVICSDLERQYEFFKMWSRRRGLHERYDTWKLTRWGTRQLSGLEGLQQQFPQEEHLVFPQTKFQNVAEDPRHTVLKAVLYMKGSGYHGGAT